MAGNYEGYAIFPGDDPYTECYEWFWASISMNETYPKEFLDELHQKMVNMIDQNKMTRGWLMTHDNNFTPSQPIPQAPTAGFQTLWVQRQLKKLRERTEALKAQYIKPDDII